MKMAVRWTVDGPKGTVTDYGLVQYSNILLDGVDELDHMILV